MLEQPWIPGDRGARVENVSIRTALLAAHDVRNLAIGDPLQYAAVLRLLVAITLDVLGAPTSSQEWGEWWRERRFPGAPLAVYCERDDVRDRFGLFDEVRPFAQVAGLRTSKGEVKPSSLLVPSAASGNNVPLFASRTEADPQQLTPAEAARWLLTAQAWDTAAIKSGAVGDPQVKAGKTTGNRKGPLGELGVILPIGRTLFETIMLNTPIVEDGLDPADVPHWRRPEPLGPTWEQRQPRGLIELLTWQSRRIRLIPAQRPDGRVVVEHVVLAAGDRMGFIPEEEPHTAWNLGVTSRTGEQGNRPRRHQSGRAAWRGLPALLALETEGTESTVESTFLIKQASRLEDEGILPEDYPLVVRIAGAEYGNQSAVIENIIGDELPLPVVALRKDPAVRAFLGDIARQAEELARAANGLQADLRRAAGGDPIPWDKSQRPGELVLHALDGPVRRVLVGLQCGADDATLAAAGAAWAAVARRTVLHVAEPLLDAVAPRTFFGVVATDAKGNVLKDRLDTPRRVTAGTADARFRHRLDEILPPAARPAAGAPSDGEVA